MPEPHIHQASGLLDLAIEPAPQLIAMVSHGNEQSELSLLLRLCIALVKFGHAVTVLDGTAMESEENPGLAQLLEYGMHATASVPPSWSVIPSQLGLETLVNCSSATQSLVDTGRFFPQDGVVIVYSSAQRLSQLLHGSGVRPILTISTAKATLLTSYLALKRILLKGAMEPTIVNVLDKPPSTTSASPNHMPTSLSDCAQYFLNYQVNALDITASANDEHPSASMGRLVLGLLEHALPLQRGWVPSRYSFASAQHPHSMTWAP